VVVAYMGRPSEAMPWPVIRMNLASVARTAIVPMQDIMELGATGRMNTPGTVDANWLWRFSWRDVDPGLPGKMADMVRLYGRAASTS
jgi:4-alpha-glucanotransferase